MPFDPVLLAPRRAESIVKGWWHDRSIDDELDACAAAGPDRLALTAVRAESGELRRFAWHGVVVDGGGADDFDALVACPDVRLIVRDAMPATPSGKIRKSWLRELLRDGLL